LVVDVHTDAVAVALRTRKTIVKLSAMKRFSMELSSDGERGRKAIRSALITSHKNE
jgi:hypothetical protein